MNTWKFFARAAAVFAVGIVIGRCSGRVPPEPPKSPEWAEPIVIRRAESDGAEWRRYTPYAATVNGRKLTFAEAPNPNDNERWIIHIPGHGVWLFANESR